MAAPIKKTAQVYRPVGAALELMYDKSPEIILSGPAGTGKTRANLEKLFICADKYAGMRGLILRKTRESLTESALVTWETKVVPERHECLEGPQRKLRQSYVFANGSEITVGGIDKASKIMSTEYDMCFVGDTKVFSPTKIERGYDRPYSGQLVTITTAAGNKLTGTPNHPVLTNHGWVGLGRLRKGDYVISRVACKPLPTHSNPDIADEPAPIAEVVRTLAEGSGGCRSAKRIKTVSMNFHGDGADGYVDVVTAGSLLQFGRLALLGNPVTKSDSGRANFEQSAMVGFGSGRKSGVTGNTTTVPYSRGFAELPHPFSVGFRSSPSVGGSLSSLGKILLPDRIDAHPGLTVSERIGGCFPRNTTHDHLLLESRDTDVQGCRYLKQPPTAGDVSADCIVEISVTDAGCGRHVYNLQTEASWYYASNIIVHNCYVQEGIELSENDWESLTTRLRNGVMPYQQIIGDTNPDKPRHWLKQRADRAQLKMLESRHEDNPTLWDAKAKQWTPAGAEYIAKLDNLTGPRKPRLRFGRWVQAEGVVYDGYDNNVHLIDRFEIPKAWPRYLVIDFGHTNPFVAQWWAEDPDGRLYRYREIYHTKKLVEDMAKLVKHLSEGEPRPRDVVCDHDAEDRATFERHSGMSTVRAIKDVSPGIQEVAGRLRIAEDGKPRIFFLRDSLVARDPALMAKAKPCCTEEEFDGFVWSMDGSSKKGEVPAKPQDDHGMDAMRYLCQWIAGKPKGGGVSQITWPEKANILDDLPPDLWHAV